MKSWRRQPKASNDPRRARGYRPDRGAVAPAEPRRSTSRPGIRTARLQSPRSSWRRTVRPFRKEQVEPVRDESFQGPDGIVQTGLDRSSGNSHQHRDIFDFELVVIPQYDYTTMFRREPLHRLGYLVCEKIVLHCLRRAGLKDRPFPRQLLLEDQPPSFPDAPMTQ